MIFHIHKKKSANDQTATETPTIHSRLSRTLNRLGNKTFLKPSIDLCRIYDDLGLRFQSLLQLAPTHAINNQQPVAPH